MVTEIQIALAVTDAKILTVSHDNTRKKGRVLAGAQITVGKVSLGRKQVSRSTSTCVDCVQRMRLNVSFRLAIQYVLCIWPFSTSAC